MGQGAVIFFILLVTFGFATYIFLMLFYPEWVGITGKEARKTMAEHQEGSKADDSDFFEKKQP
jgi:hypothetical protein